MIGNDSRPAAVMAAGRAPTMTAVGQHRLGDPDVLELVTVPVPRPGPGEVLVRVAATSLNPTDWVHRRAEGFLGAIPAGAPPRVLGWDVSGTVESVGLGVTLHDVGDDVFGMLPYPGGHGAAAEYVVAPARALVPKPRDVPHTHAAAVSLAGVTAVQALIDTAHLRPGDRVLVHAGAGGVGHLATQLAAGHGAHVVATASRGHHDFVTECGACQVIDYTATPFEDEAHDIDVVIDCVGGDYPDRSARTLRDGRGTIVSLALNRTERLPARPGLRHKLMLVEADHYSMCTLEELLADGVLTPHLAATFPLDRAADGHRLGETGHVAGKIVLTT